MSHPAISFETYEVAAPPDPARMDVTAFVGFASPRTGVALPTLLVEQLAQTYGDAGDILINRPVPVGSVAMFDALYDTDNRLAALAEITGGALSGSLPGSGVEPVLTVIVDGVLHDIDLLPLPLTPDDALLRIENGLEAASLPVIVDLVSMGDAQALHLTLIESHGVGTLSVLPYPALGFVESRRAEAQLMPSPMGLAVRQFFESGGITAVIVALGHPPAYDTPREVRLAGLTHLINGSARAQTASFPDVISGFEQSNAVSPLEPAMWHGIEHLIAAEDVTFICLPDLVELVAPRPEALPDLPAAPLPTEAFKDCLPDGGSAGADTMPRFAAPEMDDTASVLWIGALDLLLGIISRELRDKFLLVALPRPKLGFSLPVLPDSAFLQVAEGWVQSRLSLAAPERLVAPDAPLAGHLAHAARAQGTFVSAGNQTVLGLHDVERRAPSGLETCAFRSDLRGVMLGADLTTAHDPAWADAPVSRLMALLLRECRTLGNKVTFEPSGPALWADIRSALRGLFQAVYQKGALAGSGEGSSYDVICDRSTMSQDDIDNGRLIAELSFLPARPVARITVRLPIATGGGRS